MATINWSFVTCDTCGLVVGDADRHAIWHNNNDMWRAILENQRHIIELRNNVNRDITHAVNEADRIAHEALDRTYDNGR